MKSKEDIFISIASKKMLKFSIDQFKRTFPTLYSIIMEALEQFGRSMYQSGLKERQIPVKNEIPCMTEEQLRRIIALGYRVSFKKELAQMVISVSKVHDNGVIEFSQMLPLNDHIYKAGECAMYGLSKCEEAINQNDYTDSDE